MNKLALVFISLLFVNVFSVPCGLCVGRGDVCLAGRAINCGDNLKCSATEQSGTATICLPTIEEGKKCTDVGVDTCEKDYACNYTGSGNCDYIGGPIRKLGDYCLDSTWCGAGLTCNGNKCALSGTCTLALSAGCPINQYCFTDACTARAGEGASCLTVPCDPPLYCDNSANPLEPKCVALFKKSENENCSSTIQCKPGLTCNCIGALCQKKCVKPVYFFLPAYGGVAWGETCEPKDLHPGCTCNFAAKTFMYLKEASDLTNPACENSYKEFYKCLADKGCNSVDTYARSCMRENCYHLYRGGYDTCFGDASLRPPLCSAQGLIAMFGLLIALLLL